MSAQNTAKEARTTRNPLDRKPSAMRPISIQTGVNLYAEGSVLVKFGNTHVLCTATIEESLPPWLKAQNKAKGETQGWITAEYSMLPRATHTRSKREREKIGGRTHEIQRLVGRALRGMVDMQLLGERSLMIDCDVLQADGGTRTAAITGGCVAVGLALGRLIRDGKCKPGVWVDTVAAVSCGIKDGQVLVDLDYNEDSTCDVDMNFVVTGSDRLIEVQGTAERAAFSREDLSRLMDGAFGAVAELKRAQKAAWAESGVTQVPSA